MLIKSLVYLGSNVLNALIPLAMLPILTRVLTVEEYGQVGLFQTLITAFAGLIGLSAAGAAGRKYFDQEASDRDNLATYIGAALQVAAATFVPVVILTYLLADPISGWLAIPAWWVVGAAVVPAFNVMIQMRLVQWQVRGAAYRYGALQVTYSIINFGFSLMLVLALGFGGEGRVIGQVAAGMLVATCALLLLRRDGLLRIFTWRPAALREIVSYGLPLVPHVIGLFLLAYADRVVIGTQLGLEEAGMYIAAVQLVGGAGLMFDAINKAYVPWLFERLARNDDIEKRKIVLFTYIWFGIIAVGIAVAFLIGPELYVLIAGRDYAEAAHIIGWLAAGHGLSGMYLMVTNYVFYSRRTGILAVTTILSAAVGLGALLLLVKPFGLLGAAWAFCLGMGVRFLLTWWAGNLRHPMPWLSALRSGSGRERR